MDFFKRDPFTGGLAVAAALLLLGALYFAYSAHSSLSEQIENYSTATATLGRLQSARPFPNEENLRAVSAEVDDTKRLLEMLSEHVANQSAPLDTSLKPRQFQDSLNNRVGTIVKLAAETGTRLPEDFYLGFAEYQTQPPSADAAPQLGQQLESIANIATLVVKAGAKEITAIKRQPLPAEATTEEAKPADEAAVSTAPFDLSFVADQAAFREAFNAIVNAKPMVFVRLVSVTNSQPVAPPKDADKAAAPAADSSTPAQIPVIFGKETLQVNLRLASVSTPSPAKSP